MIQDIDLARPRTPDPGPHIEQKRRLLQGVVDGDIGVKPPSPEATLDISEGPNALNGWTTIKWKYNPAIIQEVLGVKILDADENM
jgi:hypothetical protein